MIETQTDTFTATAVYCITPTTEEMARRVKKLGQPGRFQPPAPDGADAGDEEEPS